MTKFNKSNSSYGEGYREGYSKIKEKEKLYPTQHEWFDPSVPHPYREGCSCNRCCIEKAWD